MEEKLSGMVDNQPILTKADGACNGIVVVSINGTNPEWIVSFVLCAIGDFIDVRTQLVIPVSICLGRKVVGGEAKYFRERTCFWSARRRV